MFYTNIVGDDEDYAMVGWTHNTVAAALSGEFSGDRSGDIEKVGKLLSISKLVLCAYVVDFTP